MFHEYYGETLLIVVFYRYLEVFSQEGQVYEKYYGQKMLPLRTFLRTFPAWCMETT